MNLPVLIRVGVERLAGTSARLTTLLCLALAVSAAAQAAGCEPAQCEQGVQVKVTPVWMDDESSPAAGRFLWAYTVRFDNQLEEPVTVLSRYWLATDSAGKQQVYSGEGVRGEQPVIHPGQRFEYSSWVPLATASGTMEGAFKLRTRAARDFGVRVPRVELRTPAAP